MKLQLHTMDIPNTKTGQKRHRSDSGSDQEFTPNWPRFIMVHGTDDRLAKLSPFAVNKGIESIVGTPKSVRRLRSGDILVEVSRPTQSENLLHTDTFVNVPVQVSPHRTLNSQKGVIRCNDIKECSDEEILSGLAGQHVTAIHRITVTRDGTRKSTGTFILTFNSPTLPAAVKVGYLNVKVNVYIPNPIRCFKCQRYGHFKTNCNRAEACEKCGQDGHTSEACANVAHCINCNGAHPANSKDCPKWNEEKMIQKLKVTGNLSYREARDKFNQENSRLVTYATAVARSTATATIETGTQTEVTWPRECSLPKAYSPPKQNKTATHKNIQTTKLPSNQIEPITTASNAQTNGQTHNISNQLNASNKQQKTRPKELNEGQPRPKNRNNENDVSLQPSTSNGKQERNKPQSNGQSNVNRPANKPNSLKRQEKNKNLLQSMKPTKGSDDPIKMHSKFSLEMM